MIEPGERRWLWWFSGILCVVLAIPYLLGYFLQGPDLVFSGFFFGVEDGNSYIAKMLQGANGAWLFRTPYTVFPQKGALVYFPLIFLGKLAAAPGIHEQLVAIFHLFRSMAVIALSFATYDFLAMLVKSLALRRLGTALVLCGGGFGWLSLAGLSLLWGGRMPLEYYSPEAFGFLMILGLPHLAWARALMLWGLRSYLAVKERYWGWKNLVKNGLVWTGVGLMQPMMIPVAWAAVGVQIGVLGLRSLLANQQGKLAGWTSFIPMLKRAVGLGLLSAPLVVYTFTAFQLDPYLSSWEKQNVLTSPPLSDYFLAYALLIPFALLGIRYALVQKEQRGIFLTTWLVTSIFLVYLPLSIQRRLIEGAWIALIGLTLFWLESKEKRVQVRISRVLAGSFLTTILLLIGGIFLLFQRYPPIYRPLDEVKVFQYLQKNAQPGEVILATKKVSNPLPAWAPLRTLAGHGPESVKSAEIQVESVRFFQPETADQQRLDFLGKYAIAYVFWGPEEQASGTWEPAGEYLKQVYQSGDFHLYQVFLHDQGDR